MALTLDRLMELRWRFSPARMANHLTQGKFIRYPHVDYVDDIISQSILMGNKRIIVSMPPRHGKSWLISRYTPAWFLSLYPDKNVILASYEAGFAASWGRQARNFIQEHSSELGIQLSDDSQAADRWNTLEGGGMITAGVGGAITGRGGDLLIIDDPVKNDEEAQSETYRQKVIDWWNSTFYTRAEPGATIIILMTRWHERDLAGYLLSKENETYEEWKEIRLPAIAEDGDPLGRTTGTALCDPRYPVGALDRIRRAVGSKTWNALYQQRPSAQEGQIIKREWLRYYDQTGPLEEQILSLDATFSGKATSDHVAMQVWGRYGARKYLLDQIYGQMGITDTIRTLMGLSSKYPKASLKLIENKANGPAIEDLLKLQMSGIVLWEPTGDKIARINAVSPQFEAGNVYFPNPVLNPWVKDLTEELVTFPNAAHDDRCFIAGTQIETLFGPKPIEKIREGEFVLTPFGFSRVLSAQETGRSKVVERHGLTGTPDHPIIGKKGKTSLDAISLGDLNRFSWKSQIRWSVLRSFTSLGSSTASWEVRDVITSLSQEPIRGEKTLKAFIALFGKRRQETGFLSAITSTIKTGIRLTMIPIIWSAYHAGTIKKRLSTIPRKWRQPWLRPELKRLSGMDLKQGWHGIGSMQRKWVLESLDDLKKSVTFVKRDSPPGLIAPVFVDQIVALNGLIGIKRSFTGMPAQTVVFSANECSKVPRVKDPGSVPGDVLDLGQPQLVYNLKTSHGVYFANGILVSNCDALSMALLRLEESMSRGVGTIRVVRA